MTKLILASIAVIAAAPAFAQGVPPAHAPSTAGTVIQRQPNTTGNDRDIVIAPGANGAETITTNSAAAGNAGHPERAVPNSSGNGSSGGSN